MVVANTNTSFVVVEMSDKFTDSVVVALMVKGAEKVTSISGTDLSTTFGFICSDFDAIGFSNLTLRADAMFDVGVVEDAEIVETTRTAVGATGFFLKLKRVKITKIIMASDSTYKCRLSGSTFTHESGSLIFMLPYYNIYCTLAIATSVMSF